MQPGKLVPPLKKCPQLSATPTGHRSTGKCREQQSKAELLRGLWEAGPHPNSLLCCFQSSHAWAGTGFLLRQREEGKGRQEAKAAAQFRLFIINIGPDVQTQ